MLKHDLVVLAVLIGAFLLGVWVGWIIRAAMTATT